MARMSKIVDFAKRVRRGSGFKTALAMPRRLAIAARQRVNHGIYSIEIEARAGFFAVMQTILFILVYCEENKLYPDITAKGGIYGDTAAAVDWFGLLFESLMVPDKSIKERLKSRANIYTSRIRGVEDLGLRAKYEMSLALQQASIIFNSHYRPRPDVLAAVDAIARDLGISSSTLAVHYRGTDKLHEAGSVPWSVVYEAVEKISAERPKLKNILLASDDVGFIESFQKYPFKIPVVIAPAAYMPQGSTPIHFSGHPGLAIGREALLTCLLLARCGFLIKTASYLSGWAKIFNPKLLTWLLSPQFGTGYFPDRALWKDQLEERHGFNITSR
jgi:hypothetical protein